MELENLSQIILAPSPVTADIESWKCCSAVTASAGRARRAVGEGPMWLGILKEFRVQGLGFYLYYVASMVVHN